MLKIRVPATSANLGPGFDALGIALSLYNELTVEKVDGVHEFLWDEPELALPASENLVLGTMMSVFRLHAGGLPGYRIRTQACNIPMARGLGSSAAAIVAGIHAADYLLGGVMTRPAIAAMATEIEGHPDNVIPCLEGGMVISTVDEGGEVVWSKLSIAPGIRLLVLVPDYKLSTSKARAVLPDNYSRADAVYNLSRVALLVTALAQGDFAKLRVALGDRLHQPHRLPLIPGAEAVIEICRQAGSLGEFISGAGPTLIAILPDHDTDFAARIRPLLDQQELKWSILPMEICQAGVSLQEC